MKAQFEIINFDVEDIITTSGLIEEDEGSGTVIKPSRPTSTVDINN